MAVNSIDNVTIYYTSGSATGTSAQKVQTQQIQETLTRRLISRNLKIITGTIAFAASGMAGSAGHRFDYELYGDRFLWLGMTPRPAGDVTLADRAAVGFLPLYNPTTRKIFLTGGGSSTAREGSPMPLLIKEKYPDDSLSTIQFCLMVTESLAGSGVGGG